LRGLSLEVGVRGRSSSARAERDSRASIEQIWHISNRSTRLRSYGIAYRRVGLRRRLLVLLRSAPPLLSLALVREAFTRFLL